ncbi:MAG TPA: [LysW]-lysine hydrolase [Thermomicrobiales bacterium]|nr:[LysW]-lysine hydrolase [Thermomicrobiales bacterium]
MASSSAPDTASQTWTAREQADIELLRALVAIPSLSHKERDAVDYLRGVMAARGFDVLDDPAGNAVGRIGSGERHIVLLGHIDTVPGHIPVRIEDGVLWGRGAVDAKGPLATFVAAASAAADRLNATVTVVGAVGEEVIGSPGANEVASWTAPDFCVIGEPSGWDAVCLGYRGSYSLIYRLTRGTRHTAGPGESVGEEAVGFWNALQAELAEWNAGAKGSFWSIGPSLRAFNTRGDGLQDVAELSIGLRLPPEIDVERLLARIRTLAGDAEIVVDGLQEGYRTTKRSKLVPPFLRGIRGQGGEPRFTLKLGTSDMNVVGPVWGCPIVAYGPGDSSLDHTPDERIELVEYLRAVRVLTDVLVSF